MDKAEQFIKDYTNHCSNLLVFAKGDKEYDYAPWLTPEQALAAVNIAREELIDKACEWLENYFKGVPSGTVYLQDFKKAIKE